MPLGLEPVAPLEVGDERFTPRQALEQVFVEALSRPPCLLSFSGGRDSSALLAVATDVARRHGLTLPIPATLVFPGSSEADEDAWQDAVLEHLGLPDRVRIEIGGSRLDAIGPVAEDVLRRHGLLWPFNTHFHVPIVEQAAGGTVVTGFAGDELALLSMAARAERFLARPHRPRVEDLLVLGLALSPRAVRTTVHRRRARGELGALPWLTDGGRHLATQAAGRQDGRVPLGWDAKVRKYLWRGRYFRVCVASFARIGEDHGVRVVHPFVDPRVLDALARAGGFAGFGDRDDLVGILFGDLLPEAVVTRPTKAAFTDSLWTDIAIDFARSWSGDGDLPACVDREALHRNWLGPDRHVMSTLLLQQAWLTSGSRGAAGG